MQPAGIATVATLPGNGYRCFAMARASYPIPVPVPDSSGMTPGASMRNALKKQQALQTRALELIQLLP